MSAVNAECVGNELEKNFLIYSHLHANADNY